MKLLTKVFAVLLLTLTFSHFFSQEKYDLQWKKVQENYQKRIYKSNLPLILDIQKQAMKDNNAVQLIRSLKVEFSILNQTHDDTNNNSASLFFKKLQEVKPSLKGDDQIVFNVLLGEFFQDYFNQNRWEINQRTSVNSQDFSQIETWSKLDFKNYLSKFYQDLDKQQRSLEKIGLKSYKNIFSETEDLEFFPTLADWNSSNKIGFLKNSSFFTKNELEANNIEILKIYDFLIAQNQGNTKLYFEHQKLNYSCGFNHCKNKLEQLEALYNSNENGDYKVLIAQEIIQNYQQTEDFKTALSWIDKVEKQFPKSKYLTNIQNQKNSILQPLLAFKYEKNSEANKPIHVVATAKNVLEFSLNIYEVKSDFYNYLKYQQREYDKLLYGQVQKTLIRKDKFTLPTSNDYKSHTTSLELESLPPGIYMADYVVNKEIVEHFSFIVSNSRLLYQNKNENLFSANILKLVNRENGKSIEKHPLEIYGIQNDQKIVKSEVSTNSSGDFKFLDSKNNQYYRTYLVRDSKTNDFNLLQVYGNNNDGIPERKLTQNIQIFLDRAIYRPGQIVYFKVINTQLKEQKENVISNLKQTVKLLDANNEEISNQNFTTNDFGSYNGSFVLPSAKLNGEFSLSVDGIDGFGNSNKPFQVEEYKRPKFEVTFEPIKGEYKYGETVELKGKATMFSGVALSNSTVNYEIKKQNIRWRYFYWYPRGNDNENSILGEVKTNEKGEFSIKIDLKKDEKIEGIQIDNYAVNASVTDINGETQSATENFKVSSVSHYINVADIPDTFSDEDLKLKVEIKNYNDQVLQKSYHLKLSKLSSEKRVIRDNFKNDIQDLPIFTKAEFIQKFPHDYFSKDEKKDKVEKVIVDRLEEPRAKNQEPITDNNQPTTNLNLGSLKAGKYKLELYNIEGKDSIKTEKTFEVFDKKSLSDSQKPFLKVVQPKAEFQRNEKTKIFVYSAIPDALVNVFVQNGKGDTFTEQKKFKNGVLEYNVDFPKDESVKQINVQFQLVAFNEVQTESVNLNIASDKKPLRIETVTFRDKIEPGQKEKWTVKVLGDDKEKINAEVLANMYDRSLDKFAVNSYEWQSLQNGNFRISNYGINEGLSQKNYSKRIPYLQNYYISKPGFNWFDNEIVVMAYGSQRKKETITGLVVQEGIKTSSYAPPPPPSSISQNNVVMDNIVPEPKSAPKVETPPPPIENLDNIPVRQNLNETAFFYPNLMTDKDGNVSFEFISPEALTQWKVMFLAHTKDARSATLEKSVVTQKEFSVTPNYPRFLREGDELQLQSKLSSLVDKPLSGTAQLQILDAFTNEDISSKFNLNDIQKSFELKENGNSVVNWTIKVPNNVSSIVLKVVAKSEPLNPLKGTLNTSYSDGEQKAIAVLPNRMLVTDAVPIFVKEGQTKSFSIENLTKNKSTTVQNFSNTLELTTNPIWEIMFALPSLKNDQNNSSDVVFNKWFADVLASEIFKANPKLKTVFEEYQSKGLLKSNLDKNQELKQLLLEETPWVLESKNEEDQMQKIARLFDANTMKNSINNDWSELQKLQNPDGGFSWYSGYPSSYSTSLYILKSLGRINVWLKGNLKDYQSSEQKEMVSKLVNYLDSEVVRYGEIDKNVVNNYVLDYLDTRNYWEKDFPLKQKGTALKNAVISKAKTEKIVDFTFFGLHRLAILFDDYGLKDISKKFLTYLKETSTESETQGIYWKQNLNDWGWFSSKVVNQAGALEAFNKLAPNDEKMIEEMKIWLITQKEVNSWGSSRGTSEVIFTILNSGKSWTSADSDKATIIWGGKTIDSSAPFPWERVGDRIATGYVKSTVKSDVLDKKLGTVTITKPGAGIVQGGLFWQYYEDLDKIKSSESYISITKELYKKVKTVNGEVLQKIAENSPLKIGDKVTVRMILNTDRSMEFIHLKDMRAAGFEPLDVISGYEYKNNLGYYQSTKDASTNFYIQYMPKGKYVFEYDYICNAAGKFSNGITTLQNYYAPQMNAHTQGTTIDIQP